MQMGSDSQAMTTRISLTGPGIGRAIERSSQHSEVHMSHWGAPLPHPCLLTCIWLRLAWGQ